MAMLSTPTGGETTSPPSMFSYAQAAKRKTPVSSAPSVSRSESSNWADDTTEATTAVEKQVKNPVEPDSSPAAHEEKIQLPFDASAAGAKIDLDRPNDTDPTASNLVASKEEDAHSDSKPSSESTWESKSQTSNTGTTSQSPSEERGRSKGNSSEKTNGTQTEETSQDNEEKVPERVLKEAPAPAVNFWQQRAQDAKLKTGKVLNSPKSASFPLNAQSPGAPSNIAQLNSRSQPTPQSNTPSGVSGNRPSTESARFSGPRPIRSFRSEGDVTATNSLPPPVGDAVSWPTPIASQDGESRTSQDQGERSDKASPPVPKSHGKQEWKPLPFTPSVKFNTPLPQRGARGGRIGVRGGRGGALVDRNGPATQSSTDLARISRVGDVTNISSEKPTTTPMPGIEPGPVPPGNENAPPLAETTVATPTQSVEPAVSGETESKSTDEAMPLQNVNSNGHDQTPVNAREHDTSRAANSSGIAIKPEFRETKSRSEPNASQPFVSRKKSVPNHFDPSADGPYAQKPRRRGSQIASRHDITNADSKENKRFGGENDHSQEKVDGAVVRDEHQNSTEDGRRNTWAPVPHRERGDGRPDRGRGYKGARGPGSHFSFGAHHGNMQLPPIQTKGTPTFTPHQFTPSGHYSSNSRHFRGGPRSTSIPNDAAFGRYASNYMNGYQYGYPQYPGSVYDYSGMAPMSANSFNPYVEQAMVISEISNQLTYYFSLENLLKDMFLRKHMDSQGFVALSLIANFKRMKDITIDTDLIKYVCLQLDGFDMVIGADGKDRLRKREDWEKWVLNIDERDPSARNDGVMLQNLPHAAYESTIDLNTAHSATSPKFTSSGANGGPQPFSATAATFSPLPMTPLVNGVHDFSSSMNSADAEAQKYQQPSSSSSTAASVRQIETKSDGPDVHHDDQNPLLSIAMRPLSSGSPNAVSLTGTTNHLSTNYVNGTTSNEPTESLTQSSEQSLGGSSRLQPDEKRRHRLSSSQQNLGQSADNAQCIWIKENEKEKFLPLPENAQYMPYEELHARALEQRQHAAHGHTPYDLFVLYNFWSHFLIRNFNLNMYEEFCQFAHEDATTNSSTVGLDSLIRYYQEALTGQSPIRGRVAHDYVLLVEQEQPEQGRPAFESLRSAWRNGATNLKNRKKISELVDDGLRLELDR